MAHLSFPTVWVPNNPEKLFDIALLSCCSNPLTFCTLHPSFGYRLREGLAIPQPICERMLEVSRTQMCDEDFCKFIRIFADSPTRLCHADLRNTPLKDSDLVAFLYHPITELNLEGCTKLNRGALKCLSKFSESLQALILGSNPDIFKDDDIPSGSYEGSTKEDSLSKVRREEIPSGSFESSLRSSNLPQISLHPQLGSFFPLRQPKLTEEDFFRDCMRIWLTKDEPKKDKTLKLLESLPKLTSLPMLRKLVVQNMTKTAKSVEFMQVVQTTSRLNQLDLSHSEVWNFEGFLHHPIISLVLFDVKDCIMDCLGSIHLMKTIKHLDISCTEDDGMMYENPNYVLSTIVNNLPNLTSLDISGTNLAGKATIERLHSDLKRLENKEVDEEVLALTDIPGLANRVDRPLEFLGLLNCVHQACYRHHIPAIRIAGDNGEEQILTAGQAYVSRESAIQKVLNDIFSLFKFSEVKNIPLALDIIIEGMQRHLRKRSIQVAGSASIFYIVKQEQREKFNAKTRRKVLKTLVDAMFAHHSDTTMLRNGCLALIHFKVPDDMFFDYERFARLLLLIASQEDQDEFVQRISVYLLNSLACQIDGIEKKLVGDHGAITIMLQLIEKRLERRLCDEVMETAWSTMWNVTDETPLNCERFLQGNGMDLFLRCLGAFPTKPELLRNMIGLLGNVAEVKELRKFLMKENYLSVFSELLDNRSDGIEVSYNAAGILSHIASDGPELWRMHGIVNIKRCAVLQKMVKAIESWNLDIKRNINYRSFKPILRLLTVYHTPEAQIWAAWALANLTKVYPEKYCLLLKKEGGIILLESLIQQGDPRITRLAQMTINHCRSFENYEDSDMSDTEENIEVV